MNKNIYIEIYKDKTPYIKQITNNKVINVTGQSGSGKTTYIKEHFNNDDYLLVDTDDIFSEKRFANAIGINKELGKYFRTKYNPLPDLSTNFDLIYQEILKYCKQYSKIVVIDCAQFHSLKDINLLKGKVIIIRTDIDTCYKRCLERFKKNNPNASEEEFNNYALKKKKIYEWYKYSNEFIKRVDGI